MAGGLASKACAQVAPAATQASDQRPLAFEVVSIRRDAGSTLVARKQEALGVTPDGWHAESVSLLAALLTAYAPTTPDAMMYTMSTIAGIPDWMRTETYDIDAKVAPADLAAWQNPATQQAMLAERCKLVVHRGTKEVSVYSLVVAKGGPKLKEAVPGDAHPGGTPIPGGGGEFVPSDGNGNAAFHDAPVRALAVVLSNLAERPVEDRTGLTGRYDMVFRRPRAGAPSTEPDPGPTIFDVVGDLGLKLEPAKSEVETLVVDHVERPTEN